MPNINPNLINNNNSINLKSIEFDNKVINGAEYVKNETENEDDDTTEKAKENGHKKKKKTKFNLNNYDKDEKEKSIENNYRPNKRIMKTIKNEDNTKNGENDEENLKDEGIKNLKKNIHMIQSNVSSYEMENPINKIDFYSMNPKDENENENNSNENINDTNTNTYSNSNKQKNKFLCESQQSQIFFINENKGEKEEKNPLSIFETKKDEEIEVSMNEIEEEEESNSDNEKEIDKELYYKKIRPKVQKNKVNRIVKAKAVSFTLDKKKKVDKFYASDFLNLNNNKNKTPEKQKENDKNLIRKNKKLEKQKRKTLQKNRILHNKIMNDILDKDKPEEKKEQIKEKEDNLSEVDEFEEQKKKMINYGSIFKDLLKVNININQIMPNKKEDLEKMNKSEGENDPYSYLYDSYGFLRTNLSLTPDSNYQNEYRHKKISKVKPSKAKIVNFYDKVRATSSENTIYKYKNSSLFKRHRLCEDKSKDKDDRDSDYKKRTFTSQFYDNRKDRTPKTMTYNSEKEKDSKSINFFSLNKLNKNTFDGEASNITNVINLNKTDNSNNVNSNISNISNDKSFKLIKCKKLPRFSTEQIKLNKSEIPIPQKKKNIIRITNNSNRVSLRRNNLSRDTKKEKVTEKTNSSKKKELKEKENKKGEKKESKNKSNSKGDKNKNVMSAQLRNIENKFRKENSLKMNELEKIKRDFKKKLISITDDLSNDKENEETSDLFYYKGPVDIKNISLMNYKDTVIELENKMRKSGYEISKIKENKFRCHKDGKVFVVQIVKIQNEILYYLINKNLTK